MTYLISLLLSFGFVQIYAQKTLPGENAEENQKSQRGILLFSVGPNLSSFPTKYGGWQLGYRVGVTVNIKVFKDILITLPLAYNRINAFQKNTEGEFYSHNYVDQTHKEFYVYKLFRDQKISLAFLEFPALLCYRFHQTNQYNISVTLGPGFALAIKDFSKFPTIKITDEIIGTHDGKVFNSFNESDAYEYLEDSGFNLNVGFRFNLRQFYMDLMYTFYPYTIKEIKKINTLSLILSLDLE